MNLYKVKKSIVLILGALIPALVFQLIMIFSRSILYSYIALIIMVIFSYIIGSMLLNNPFTGMLEGKGILTFSWDSRGNIVPFLVGVDPPMIKGKFKNKIITDYFDRKLVSNMSTPVIQESGVKKDKEGNLTIELDHELYQKSKHKLYDIPVIFYNENLKSTITKDMISDLESNTIAEHQILYQNQLIKDLDRQVAPFARGAVDSMKRVPGDFIRSPWFWIIIVALVVVLGVAFLPKIITILQGSLGGVTSAVESASTVIPK